MTLVFDVVGKAMENPSPEDISNGFGSIKSEGMRIMRSISVIELHRQDISLYAFGHPKDGYSLEIGEARSRKFTSADKPLTQSETICIFQAFARGDDSWQSKFDWEQEKEIPPTVVFKRVMLYLAAFGLLVIFFKYVLKII